MEKQKIIIRSDDDDFGAVLNCAVRYALGRRTYMPGLVCDWITPRLGSLTMKTLVVFHQDITEQRTHGGYGDPCDETTWLRFQAAVLKEIDDRLHYFCSRGEDREEKEDDTK